MEDREVELIEYLRVLWWGKWIILACLVVAFGVAMAIVVFEPISYRSSMDVALRQHVTAALSDNRSAATALDEAVATALERTERAVPGIKAIRSDDRITLSATEETSREAILQTLALGEEALREQLPAALDVQLEYLSTDLQFQENALAAQLNILGQRLTEERTSGNLPVSEALAAQIGSLEAQRVQVQVRLDTLRGTGPEELVSLSTIRQATVTTSSPRLRTTLAIAGFLGLVIGVLLAFFIHYLIQVRRMERTQQVEPRS